MNALADFLDDSPNWKRKEVDLWIYLLHDKIDVYRGVDKCGDDWAMGYHLRKRELPDEEYKSTEIQDHGIRDDFTLTEMDKFDCNTTAALLRYINCQKVISQMKVEYEEWRTYDAS
jgi:hypothetical protein